ncbi:hypothetical protein ACSSS7_000561 [Eimeria intestinalis]
MAFTERGAPPSSMRRGPRPAGVLQSFAVWVLVSGALTLCFRASSQSTPAGTLEPPHQALIERDEKGGEKWLVPFIVLLAFVVGVAFTILVIYIANIRSLRKREAVAAKQAAPELFQNSDNESPTPRDRRGIWETNKAAQLGEEGETTLPDGSY